MRYVNKNFKIKTWYNLYGYNYMIVIKDSMFYINQLLPTHEVRSIGGYSTFEIAQKRLNNIFKMRIKATVDFWMMTKNTDVFM